MEHHEQLQYAIMSPAFEKYKLVKIDQQQQQQQQINAQHIPLVAAQPETMLQHAIRDTITSKSMSDEEKVHMLTRTLMLQQKMATPKTLPTASPPQTIDASADARMHISSVLDGVNLADTPRMQQQQTLLPDNTSARDSGRGSMSAIAASSTNMPTSIFSTPRSAITARGNYPAPYEDSSSILTATPVHPSMRRRDATAHQKGDGASEANHRKGCPCPICAWNMKKKKNKRKGAAAAAASEAKQQKAPQRVAKMPPLSAMYNVY